MPLYPPAGGGGGGGSDPTKLPLAGGVMDVDAAIEFDSGAKIQVGTTDAGIGGGGGIALRCSVDYEFKWEAGRLFIMEQDGFTIRAVRHTFDAIPGVNNDATTGFIVGSRWILDDGTIYVCSDSTGGAAVWAVEASPLLPTEDEKAALDNSPTALTAANPVASMADVAGIPKTFADAAARAAAVPAFAGQLGEQLDNGSLWKSNSTTQGDWSAPMLNVANLGVIVKTLSNGLEILSVDSTENFVLYATNAPGVLADYLATSGGHWVTPTADPLDNSTRLATTAYVDAAVAAALASPTTLAAILAAASITPIADNTYTLGLGVTNNGTETTKSGIITNVQEAS